MGDMAEILGTSTPFLSAVENGKKNVPAEWIQKLTDYYGLSQEEKRCITRMGLKRAKESPWLTDHR